MVFARLFVAFAAVVSMLVAPQSQAETYPDGKRPIQVIVGFPPAGGVDVLARFMFERMTPLLGDAVIDNKVGASGVIGSRFAAAAKPDGYTLLMGALNPEAINPGDFVVPRQPMDWKLDPVALVATAPMLLIVRADLGIKDYASLRAWLKANRAKASYGSECVGCFSHVQMELLLGDDVPLHVPYRGGPPALLGLMAGDVPFMFSAAPVALPQLSSGRFVVVAQTGATRLAALPNVPTMAEVGVPNFKAPLWWGIFAPAGTPPAIRERIAAAVAVTLRQPDTVAWMDRMGFAPPPAMSPEAFGRFVDGERARWSAVVERIISR